jgi:DNA-binding response OmpR family regulator
MTRAKVLLVDIDSGARNGLQEVLEHHDFEVVPATSVTEALNTIVSQRFDILITDLNLPNPNDGFTVLTAMRHSQPWAMTVTLRDTADREEVLASILQHADRVLEKPVAVKHLVELIRVGMRGRQSQ